jgi:glycosyltransferase involved in cell wall biosynthesis
MNGELELSVVIPFRNAGRHLAGQLEALAGEELDRPWEVVLVDNGSTDDSRRVAESFRGRLDLRIVDASARVGTAYASNVGARAASGRKLVFLDADDQIAPGYLAAMAAALDRHDFVTSSFDHEALNPLWVQRAHGRVWRDASEPLPVFYGLLPAAGASIVISRPVLEGVGGFPEDFPRLHNIALSWEIQLAGTPLHHVPDAVYRVRYRDSLWGLYRQAFSWAACSPLLYRRYRHAGMGGKPARQWLKQIAQLAWNFRRARTRADLAPLVVRLGYGTGILAGIVRYRTLYFGAPSRPPAAGLLQPPRPARAVGSADRAGETSE